MGLPGVGILLPQILEQGSLGLELIFQGSGLVSLTRILPPSWVIFFSS